MSSEKTTTAAFPASLGSSAASDGTAVSNLEAQLPDIDTCLTINDAPPRNIHGLIWFLAVVATLSSVFLYALDNTIVADITPTVINVFGDADNLPWLSVGFLLGGETAVLPLGRLYGLFDAKRVYIASALIFNLGSAVCGAAPNLNALIIGRVLAGLGGNGMYLGVITLLSVNTSDRERPGYLGLNGVVWGVGTILGPVVGGALAESSASWRWAFYLNLCVAAACAPVYVFLVPSFKPRKDSRTIDLVASYDFVGTIVSIGALITLFMAVNFGGTLYAWDSSRTIGLFVASGILFAAFGVQQTLCIATAPTTRLFPVQFLKNLDAVRLFISTAAINCACFIPIYYIPLYFQFTRNDGAIDAAVRLLPYISVLSFAILANGHFMGQLRYYQPWYMAGSALTLVGAVLLSHVKAGTSTAEIYGYQILAGLGSGACAQAGYAVIQAMIPPEETAYAISFIMLAQTGGIALGLSLSGAVFVNSAVAGLTSVLPDVPLSQLQLAVTGTSGAYFHSLSLEKQTLALEVIVEALSKVFILVYVGGAVTLLCSLLFKTKKL